MYSQKGAPRRRSLRKCPKLSHGEEETDPFSRLNDDIIASHILSRLSLQEAVRTSVLSRRWLTLWPASIGPKLIFAFPSGYSRNYPSGFRLYKSKFTCLLIHGVNNVLNAYSKSTLDELTVCFRFDSSSSQFIDSWVQYAFRMGASRLHLDFSHWLPCDWKDIYTFPGRDKLSALHIQCNNNLHLPVNCIGMYNLRDVFLKHINVPSEVIDFMISHCPLLERLSVWDSQCFDDLSVSTQSSNLKSLELVDCCYMDIKISTPCLVSLRYYGVDYLIDNLHLEYVPLLSELSIGRQYARYFLRPNSLHYGYISQIKKLTLDLDDEVISESIKYRLEFPEFVKLEQLEVKLKAKKDSCLLWPIILIKAAPFLHRFCVEVSTKFNGREDPAKLQHGKYQRKLRRLLNAIKQVHHQFLKLIEIKGFCGKPSEVELCQHLLGISGSLEQIVVEPLLRVHMGKECHKSVTRYRKRAQKFRNWLPPAVNLVIL